MSKLETLATRRDSSSQGWTPIECIRQLLHDLEENNVSCDILYVAMRDSYSSNSQRFPNYCAGGSALELAGLLSYHTQKLTGD